MPADGALEQEGDAVPENLAGGQPDGVLEALDFQELVNLGRGGGGIGGMTVNVGIQVTSPVYVHRPTVQ